MCFFHTTYAQDQIGETVFPQFSNLPTVQSGRRFYLSWSHDLTLMRMTDVNEWHFYEIEAVKNNLSLQEIKRPFTARYISGWH